MHRPYESGSPIDVGVNAVEKAASAVASPVLSAINPMSWYRTGERLGNYLSSAPQPEAEEQGASSVTAPPTPNTTTGAQPQPEEQGQDQNSVLFGPGEWEKLTAGRRAADYKPKMRAIRMPNGSFVFTNRDELGGEEFSTGDAGQLMRESLPSASQSLAASTPTPYIEDTPRTSIIDPTSRTMQALVRASARAQSARIPGAGAGSPSPVGRMVSGQTPDTRGGSVSMIEGTPQQQVAQKLQDSMGTLALLETQQEEAKARMSPAERAMVENPAVVQGAWAVNQFRPMIEGAMKEARERMAAITTVGSPTFIADPKLQKAALQKIQSDYEEKTAPLLEMFNSLYHVQTR